MNKFSISLITLSLFVCVWFFVKITDRATPINLTTKTCLITGASSGIGQALAEEMIAKGWRVIGIARREAQLREIQ